MADAKQAEKATSEDLYNGSSQSRAILAKPRLGGFGSSNFASSSNKTCNPFGSVLRAPQLKASSNPFYKHVEICDDLETEKKKTESTETVTIDRLQDKKEVDPPKFVPLASGGATSRVSNSVPTPAQPTTTTSSPGFVFGQNLSERVVMVESVNNGETSSPNHSTSNGTTELLFTNAAASVKENTQEEVGEKSGDGLAAAAAEYERSHARPPPPTTNCTMTGEEDEINILQITCRLFAWEAGSWRERGHGLLRLNDAAAGSENGNNSGSGSGSGGGSGSNNGSGSRLVVRVSGSLRVVLNTKLWPDMVVERAGAKSLRITAVDSQLQIKLYLIMGAPGDIFHLYRALTTRISGSKRAVNNKQNATSQRAAERLEAATDDGDFMGKPEDNDEETPSDDEKQHLMESKEDENGEPLSNRLENDPKQQTDEDKSHENNEDNQDIEKEKALKRKEPADEEITPKRQCPEILIQRP